MSVASRFLLPFFNGEARIRHQQINHFLRQDYKDVVRRLTDMLTDDLGRGKGSAITYELRNRNDYGNNYSFCHLELSTFHRRSADPGRSMPYITAAFAFDIPVEDMATQFDLCSGNPSLTARHYADQIKPAWRRHIAKERLAARSPASERHL